MSKTFPWIIFGSSEQEPTETPEKQPTAAQVLYGWMDAPENDPPEPEPQPLPPVSPSDHGRVRDVADRVRDAFLAKDPAAMRDAVMEVGAIRSTPELAGHLPRDAQAAHDEFWNHYTVLERDRSAKRLSGLAPDTLGRDPEALSRTTADDRAAMAHQAASKVLNKASAANTTANDSPDRKEIPDSECRVRRQTYRRKKRELDDTNQRYGQLERVNDALSLENNKLLDQIKEKLGVAGAEMVLPSTALKRAITGGGAALEVNELYAKMEKNRLKITENMAEMERISPRLKQRGKDLSAFAGYYLDRNCEVTID